MSEAAELVPPPPDLSSSIAEAITKSDAAWLEEALQPLALSDALREVSLLAPSERAIVLSLLSPQLAGVIIEEAPRNLGGELLASLDPDRAVEVLDTLESDIEADLVGAMSVETAETILAQMDRRAAAQVRLMASYADDTAGGLMMTEVFRFSRSHTVGSVLKSMIDDEHEAERYRGQHPYVVNNNGKLAGVLSLRGLLTAKRSEKVSSIMAEPMAVPVTATLSELEDILDKQPFLGIPVVDEKRMLLGAVSRSSVSAALLERAESENLKRQGVMVDELRSMPTLLRSRRRLAWLTANIVLNIIAASVISAYEEVLLAVIALAVFLPMVSDMSGCSGNQAVGVTLRELSLGLVRPIDAFRVWLKEISVGVINGIALGVLIGIVAWVWKGNPALGLVIGLALALNTMLAVSIGGVVPLLLKRFDQDPAAASGPLLTTVTDMAGFFFVLSLASLMMPWLV